MNEKIRARLFEYNKFWKEQLVFDYVDREIYPEIIKVLQTKQIVSLCGLRRVGKTTLFFKIIQDLLKSNDASTILYFSFDDFQVEPEEVIREFEEIHGTKPKYVFFDEVQKLQNWGEKIKILYDFNKYKIFLSGSESLFIRQGNLESLAGRIYEFEVAKLSFREYLCFKNKVNLLKNPVLYNNEIEREFHEYIRSAGFPELINERNDEIIKKYIKSLIDKVIFIDMPKLYKVDDPSKIKLLLELIISNPGMIINLQSLSNEFGVHRATLSKYLEYLEVGHLIVKIYNFSRNKSTSEKKLKKFYPSILAPSLADNLNENYYSKIMEGIVIQHTNAVYFWQDQYKDEVDIIKLNGKDLMPIEVKYSEKPSLGRGLAKFSEKYSCKKAFVVTKSTTRTDHEKTEIYYVPVHQYLLQH